MKPRGQFNDDELDALIAVGRPIVGKAFDLCRDHIIPASVKLVACYFEGYGNPHLRRNPHLRILGTHKGCWFFGFS